MNRPGVTVPTASSGCTEASKRSRAATLRGLASAFSGSSSKPEQPEPPRMQPLSRPHGTPTGSGGIAALAIPPGALWYFLAREKVHASTKDKQQRIRRQAMPALTEALTSQTSAPRAKQNTTPLQTAQSPRQRKYPTHTRSATPPRR